LTKRWSGAGAARSANGATTAIVRFPVASEESSSPGLRWIVMAVVVTLPWTRTEMGVAVLVRASHDSSARE
jgi:hypothetical protein